MDFYDPNLDQYVVNHSAPEPPLLQELNRETWAKILVPQMIAGHYQGRFLSMITHMIRPKAVLEIGTFTGYSALCMAEALADGGKITTLEVNEELEDMIRQYFERSGKSHLIDLMIGNATAIIPTLEGPFDMVYIDADKINYSNYFDLVIDKVRPGGFIIADNVLWSGKVLTEKDKMDPDTRALDEYNSRILYDDRVENCLFPIRDGLNIARKKG